MNYLVKDTQLLIHYSPGKGAWTYYIELPNTKDLKGKWGDLKVSGFIDNYPLERKNIAPKKGFNKILSVGGEIKQAIGKSGGDIVTVTLHLLSKEIIIDQKHILECFKDADVFKNFQSLKTAEQKDILNSILALSNEDKQIEKIVHYISKLA